MCPTNLCKALHDVYFTHQNAQQYQLGAPVLHQKPAQDPDAKHVMVRGGEQRYV
jgi:hypothetical protein